ncbi:MAG: ABC transporter substrate-binding protein [Deltaproteobacteria bacterium]|nr:ABC transporter substrate-binding protein [Deltaproteobacteria bacterium]
MTRGERKHIIVSLVSCLLAADAPHPEAARLFVDFAISKEGQSHIRAAGRISPRPDLPPLYAQLNPAKLKLHPVQPETSENYEQLLKEWQEIFQ